MCPLILLRVHPSLETDGRVVKCVLILLRVHPSLALSIDGARDIFDVLGWGDFFFAGQDFSYSFKPELSVTSIDVATVLSLLAFLVQKYKY
jgi:hypothetical protein